MSRVPAVIADSYLCLVVSSKENKITKRKEGYTSWQAEAKLLFVEDVFIHPEKVIE